MKIFIKFSLCHNCSPLENNIAMHWNILERSASNDTLCQVYLKLVQWFWKRNLFNMINDNNFLTELIGFPRVCFVSSAVEIFLVILEINENIQNTKRHKSGRRTTEYQRKKLILTVSLGQLNRKAAILMFCFMYYLALRFLRHFR